MKVFTLYLFLEFCFIPKIKVLELKVPSFQNLRTLEDNCDPYALPLAPKQTWEQEMQSILYPTNLSPCVQR